MASKKTTTKTKTGAKPAESETTTDEPKPVETVADLQFPSLAGEPEVEVAERAADTFTPEAEDFHREFIVLKEDYDNGDKSAIHERDGYAMRQELIHQGLRPTEDKPRVSAKNHRDGFNKVLRYSIKAVPAAVASAEVAHAEVIPGSYVDEESE